jgi:hypothetical protein
MPLQISTFAALAPTATGESAMIPMMPAIVSQEVAITAGSLQSTVLGECRMVRLLADEDCRIAVGVNPTAVADATCIKIPAGVDFWCGVAADHKVAVIGA